VAIHQRPFLSTQRINLRVLNQESHYRRLRASLLMELASGCTVILETV
jgi:hypothetical protein